MATFFYLHTSSPHTLTLSISLGILSKTTAHHHRCGSQPPSQPPYTTDFVWDAGNQESTHQNHYKTSPFTTLTLISAVPAAPKPEQSTTKWVAGHPRAATYTHRNTTRPPLDCLPVAQPTTNTTTPTAGSTVSHPVATHHHSTTRLPSTPPQLHPISNRVPPLGHQEPHKNCHWTVIATAHRHLATHKPATIRPKPQPNNFITSPPHHLLLFPFGCSNKRPTTTCLVVAGK